MGKAVRGKDGKLYRTRRGKLVEIPAEWVGRFTTPATIRRRDSKLTHKLARTTKWRRENMGSSGGQYIRYMDEKQLYDEDVV